MLALVAAIVMVVLAHSSASQKIALMEIELDGNKQPHLTE